MSHAAPVLPDGGKRDAWATHPARHLKRPADRSAEVANLAAELAASRLPHKFHLNTGQTGIPAVGRSAKPRWKRGK